MFCYNYLSFHLSSKSAFIQGMTDERRETETRFIMNDYVYEFTRKRKRHMLFRRCFYGSLILIAWQLAFYNTAITMIIRLLLLFLVFGYCLPYTFAIKSI